MCGKGRREKATRPRRASRAHLLPPPLPLPPHAVPVDFIVLATSIIDGESLLRSFVDPVHAEHGSLGAPPESHDGGDGDGEAPAQSREAAAAAVRADAVAASIAGAGKLGARPPPSRVEKPAAGLFGGWGAARS